MQAQEELFRPGRNAICGAGLQLRLAVRCLNGLLLLLAEPIPKASSGGLTLLTAQRSLQTHCCTRMNRLNGACSSHVWAQLACCCRCWRGCDPETRQR